MKSTMTREEWLAFVFAVEVPLAQVDKFIECVAKEHTIANLGQDLEELYNMGWSREELPRSPLEAVRSGYQRCVEVHSDGLEGAEDFCEAELKSWRSQAKKDVAALVRLGMPLTLANSRLAFEGKLKGKRAPRPRCEQCKKCIPAVEVAAFREEARDDRGPRFCDGCADDMAAVEDNGQLRDECCGASRADLHEKDCPKIAALNELGGIPPTGWDVDCALELKLLGASKTEAIIALAERAGLPVETLARDEVDLATIPVVPL